ncbi:ABC transporter substrate-binding protein [Novosphingobium barchaimii]|nr:ABC transporter substrate-binding protein [Novosphingobium barchaimii]
MPATVRVGVLNDMADSGPGSEAMVDWIEREVAILRDRGLIPTPVEFVHAYGLGLPSGTAEAIENAYHELVQQDVVLVVGPGVSDNALIVAPLAERARLPTLHWSGAERARGRYTFQLQGGSHEEEPLVIARHLAGLGSGRVAVVHDGSPVGMRLLTTLVAEASMLGLEILAREALAGPGEAEQVVARLMAAAPDGVVFLGVGASVEPLAQELRHVGWGGQGITNSAGMAGLGGTDPNAADGWYYVAMHSEANETFRRLCADAGPQITTASLYARGHDLGRLVAQGIARAPDISREGLRLGLELVKWLPAAQGEEGTLLGFGNQDRGALHGRYLVIRQWQDGENRSIG